MPPDFIDRLRALLRHDPSDADAAFLIDVASRVPLVLERADRERLERLAGVTPTTFREGLLASVAGHLLARAD